VLSAAVEADPAAGAVSARSGGPAVIAELPGTVIGAAAAGVSGTLAFTGANSWVLVTLALLAMTAGLALVIAGRRTA
jgi:hypothetical protein